MPVDNDAFLIFFAKTMNRKNCYHLFASAQKFKYNTFELNNFAIKLPAPYFRLRMQRLKCNVLNDFQTYFPYIVGKVRGIYFSRCIISVIKRITRM